MKAKIVSVFRTAIISLLLLEFVCRVIIYVRTPEGLQFDDELVYTGAPNQQLFNVALNDVGCIGPDWKSEKGETEKRVLLLGGSTSYSREYPESLQRSLAEVRPEFKLSVMSCGKPRYTSWINLVNFKENLLQYNPDVVVLYLGINDCIYNTFPWVEELPDIGYFNWKSTKSLLSYKLLKYHLVDKQIRSEPEFAGRELRSREIFENNISEIISIASANQIKVVLSTFALGFPTSDDRLENAIYGQETRMQHFWGNVNSTVYGVKQHNEVMTYLADKHEIPLVRIDQAVPATSEFFSDICHMTDKGKALMGEAFAGVTAGLLSR